MKQEKIFVLETGRSIKIITEGILAEDLSKVTITTTVLIKNPREEEFHLPIGETHPKFWKLKQLDEEKSRLLHIKYSGVTDKMLKKAAKAFDQMLHPEPTH